MATVPPITRAPGPTSIGVDSPVIDLQSTTACPLSTTPSVATFSPGRTTKRSPTMRSVTGRRRSAPWPSRIDTSLAPTAASVLNAFGGATTRPRFEVTTGQQEGGDTRRHVEVERTT